MEKLLIVAGAGTYPECLVKGAKAAGVRTVDVVAVAGSTSRATRKAADRVIPVTLGSIAACMRQVGQMGYDGVIMAGQINPLSLFRGRFDREVQGWLDSLPVKSAHTIFQLLIEKLGECGLKVLPASLYLDALVPGAGVLSERAPTERELSDLRHAMTVARDVGVHDVGQSVLVKEGMVLAVEAFEGTNRAILRGGKLGRGGVLFKAAREGHDMRFDIPVVGLKTFKVMRRAGVTALGFQAGRLIFLDREAALKYARRHSLAVIGIDSGLPPAPLRP